LKEFTHNLRDRAKVREVQSFAEAGPGDPTDVFGRKAVGPEMTPMVPASRYMPTRPSPGGPEVRVDPSMRTTRSTTSAEPSAASAPKNIVPYQEVPTWSPGQPNPPGNTISAPPPPAPATPAKPLMSPGAKASAALHGAIAAPIAGQLAVDALSSMPGVDPLPDPNTGVTTIPYDKTVYGYNEKQAAAQKQQPQPADNQAQAQAQAMDKRDVNDLPPQSKTDKPDQKTLDVFNKSSGFNPEESTGAKNDSKLTELQRLAGILNDDSPDPEAPSNTSPASNQDKVVTNPEPPASTTTPDLKKNTPDEWDEFNQDTIPLKSQPGVMTSPSGSYVMNTPSGTTVFKKGGGGGGGGSPDSAASSGGPSSAEKTPSPSQATTPGSEVGGTPAQSPAPPPGEYQPMSPATSPESYTHNELQKWNQANPDKKVDTFKAKDIDNVPDSVKYKRTEPLEIRIVDPLDPLDTLKKNAGIQPEIDPKELSKDLPSGAAVEPGTPMIAGPDGYKPSTGDVTLPDKITDKEHITVVPNKEPKQDMSKLPGQGGPGAEDNPLIITPKQKVTVKPEQPDDKPTPDALAAFKDMMDKLAQDQELEPQPVTKPETQPKTQDELYKELLAKEPEQQRVTPTEPEKTEPEKTEPKPQAPSYARPTPTTSFNKPVEKPPEKPPEEPAKTEPQPQAPSYARPSPTTTFDKPTEKPPEPKTEPQQTQPTQTPPTPSYGRPAPSGTFGKPGLPGGTGDANAIAPADQPGVMTSPKGSTVRNTPTGVDVQPSPQRGKPGASGPKYTENGHELATDDPNDNRPVTYDNQGRKIIDPYITKGGPTSGISRDEFAQKEFGSSAEQRASRAGGGKGDPREREYNMSPGGGGRGGGAGKGDGTGRGPGQGTGTGGGQGGGEGTGKGDGKGPGKAGRDVDHKWLEMYSGDNLADIPSKAREMGKDWVRVGPGLYRSRLHYDHPDYDKQDLTTPENTQKATGKRPWATSHIEDSQNLDLKALNNMAKTLRERAYYKETGVAEATPPQSDKPQVAVSVPAGQPKPATPAPMSTDPNASKTTAAGTPVPPTQPAGPAGITAPKPVDTSAANPASGTSSANNSTNMPKPANNSEPVENSGETTESINTLRRLAGLNK